MHELLERMNDEQLLLEINIGNEDAMDILLSRYFSLVKYRVRQYYLSGGEDEDLLQEGYIGLFKAVRTYDRSKSDAFYPFAKMCIENQLRTAVTASNRKKHLPLNTSISMDDDERREFQSQEGNPEHIILAKEREADRAEKIETRLSKFEKKVILLYLNGMSYTEIAEQLEKKPKSIDNAIQRIKKKLLDDDI
ncbi:MAG: sigma-70 family RNA polymerase sigma factor [Lachnospiraceae bacterium]|nr:sigma-70 family RNA polymerase sigma factor [Lachnospiraceae bacterium]